MFNAIRTKLPAGALIDNHPVNRMPPAGAGYVNGIYSVETFEDAAGFRRLKDEWNALVEQTPGNRLFLTWEWLYTWWRHLRENRSLVIVTVRRGHELVLIAPLCTRPAGLKHLYPFRRLEFMGTGFVGSDYLDILIHPNGDDEGLTVLGAYLARRNRLVDLPQMDGGSGRIMGLMSQMGRRDWEAACVQTDVCPYIDFSGLTWDAFVGGLGRSHRTNFKRKLKKMHKLHEVSFDLVKSEDDRDAALDVLFRLHHKRWDDNGGSDAFHTDGLIAFHREFSRVALEKGWLRLYLLSLDGKPVAAIYGFMYRRLFYFYQAGFDPEYASLSLGLVAQGLAIQAAMEEGATGYDFLHGDERYKSLWTRDNRKLVRLVLMPPGYQGFIYRQAAAIKGHVKQILNQLRSYNR